MPFVWNNFRTLAAALAVGTTEAEKRTAISRAYYAAFNEADAWLQSHGLHATAGDRHGKVWGFFSHGSSAARQIAIDGVRLHRNRVSADYDPAFGGVDLVAARALGLSRKLEAALMGLSPSDVKPH